MSQEHPNKPKENLQFDGSVTTREYGTLTERAPRYGRRPIDVHALEDQIYEKQQQTNLDRERDLAYEMFDRTIAREDEELRMTEKSMRKAELMNLKTFRLTQASEKQVAEYTRKISDQPDVEEDRKFLKFDDDCGEAEQKRKLFELKRIQMAQINANDLIRRDMKIADEEYVMETARLCEMYENIVKLEEKAKQQEMKNVRECNMLMAHDCKLRKMKEKQQDEGESLDHIYNCLTSDLLMGTDSLLVQSKKADGGGAQISKPSDLIDAIEKVRREQIEEKKKVEAKEEADEKEYEHMDMVRSQELRQYDELVLRQKRDERLKINDFNRVLALEKKMRKKEHPEVN